ncbi:MAG: phosphatase PAP2 family protein [Acidimicrobiales bacterium]
MIAVVVVVGVSLTLAAVTAASTVSSVSSRWHTDPVDPAPEQRRVERALRRSDRARAALRRHTDRWSAGTVLIVTSLVVLLAVSVVVGVLLDMIDEQRGLASLDSRVAEWGAAHATTTSTRVIEAITQLGARPVVMAALLLAALSDAVRRRNKEVFAFVAAVGLGEMLLNNAIKLIVHRERPPVLHLVEAGGWSFPSGHTSAAAAGWMAVALVLGRNRPRRVRAGLAAGAVLIATAVATSRALLGVHWFTDVLAGLMVGWGWYLLVAIAFGGRRQRLGEPVERVVAGEAAHDLAHTDPAHTDLAHTGPTEGAPR